MLVLFSITGVQLLHAQKDSTDLFAQQDADNKKDSKSRTDYTIATFKTTRLINGHSIENVGRGILDVKISHRFGPVGNGLYDLFGLDYASMRMGFDYGITENWMVGIGRSTFQKQVDAFVKVKLLKQSTGKVKMPISLAYVFTTMAQTLKDIPPTKTAFNDRLYYANQLIVARKFSENFSLQLMPTMITYNKTPLATDPKNLFSLGMGARQKLSKKVSINGEYYHQFNQLARTYNSLSFGFDIETGGHVFQIHFTNSTGMTERTFITETSGTWADGSTRLGFNIARVFRVGKRTKALVNRG